MDNLINRYRLWRLSQTGARPILIGRVVGDWPGQGGGSRDDNGDENPEGRFNNMYSVHGYRSGLEVKF
jgi:hypothetical protein